MPSKIALDAIEKEKGKLIELSKKLWEHPEVGYTEEFACKETAAILKEAGFTVEIGVGGVPTAIKASWGSGHPILGFLGEYDALPGMSQKLVEHKEPVVDGAPGQGCGHNLLGTASVGAVLGAKAEMEAKKLPGTLVFFGCPGEELLTGKAFMARAHVFDGIDAAFAYHPGEVNRVTLGTMTGLNSVKFHFKGITAHAGGDPHNGRSALDAVELTNVGANYLREHVKSDVRIHYTITEGGVAPNIVPDKACVWYYVRALKREDINDVYRRLVRVAEGAAHMTETELEIEFLGGCYPTLNNPTLAHLLDDTLRAIPQEPWTEEELAFARALNEQNKNQYESMMARYGEGLEELPLFTGTAPMDYNNGFGSTDVGDVGHIVPTAFFTTVCANLGAPGHSWHITACSGSTIGQKGMVYGAQVMAAAAIRFMEDPTILEKAKADFQKGTGGKPYLCPIPDEVPVPYTK